MTPRNCSKIKSQPFIPCVSAGTNKSPSSAYRYNFTLFRSQSDKLRVVHSIDGVIRVKNDVVVLNNVSPRQAPNQLKISFWKISFSLSLSQLLTLHFKFQKPISFSLLSLIDKHLQSMETSSAISIGTCLKEHQKIYKEWFNIADSGFSVFLPPLLVSRR